MHVLFVQGETSKCAICEISKGAHRDYNVGVQNGAGNFGVYAPTLVLTSGAEKVGVHPRWAPLEISHANLTCVVSINMYL